MGSRFGLWLMALACGAVAFGALGRRDRGARPRGAGRHRCWRSCSSLPLAFLALVPSGRSAHGLYEVIAAISFVFPFKSALQALDAAVNGASPGLGVSVAHLVVLTLAFAALARVGLRRVE